jgi:hypothetical protein
MENSGGGAMIFCDDCGKRIFVFTCLKCGTTENKEDCGLDKGCGEMYCKDCAKRVKEAGK